MGRTHTSDNPAGLETRGRPRERERRTAGTMKERSRERDFGRTTGRKSRTPPRTKAPLIRSSTSTITSSNRNQEVGRRSDQLSRVDRGHDREKSRDRNQLQAASSKLRMDRNRDRDREKDIKTGNNDKDAKGNRKRLVELDRVVKRAREERSSYWNKRVLEAEEKDPNRWGHSGFKELYRRDMKLGNQGRSNSPLASASNAKTFRRSSPERPRRLLQQDPPRGISARGRNRSKSPPSKSKSRTVRQSPSSFHQPTPAAPRPLLGTNRRSSPFLDDLPESKRNQDRRRNNDRSNVLNERRAYSDRVATSKSAGSRNLDDKADYRGWSEKRGNSRILRKSPSGSLSRSRTRSSMSPPAKMKRSSNLSSSKTDPKGKDSWSRTNNMGISNSHARSRSRSSSSSSSKDEDVLELHAKSRRKGSSISSQSSSSSTDEESKSNSSSSSAESSKRRNASGSSSSTSSSESDSDDDDSDISGKVEARTKPMSSRLYNKDAGKPGSKGKPGEESRTGTKRQIAGSSAVSSKVPRKSTVSSKETRNNEKSAAGDSESESGSSSDSDSEPRMTLSERFAKLTQMSTDKREFAKPVLAMNEIDTKLKVVKDLRNADVKIYVDGLQQKNENSSKFENTKMRPKSPDYSHADGEKRYSSDDRRRHFERMARDEPRERPADWSDSRVRYEYYRDRGYFNDRPLTFEEYFKWEQWWYEYRDWLETEGYFPRVDNSAPRGNHGQFLGNAEGGSRGSRGGDWNQSSAGLSSRMRPGPGQPPPRSNPVSRRVEQVPVRMIPLSSRTHFMGRTDGRGRGPTHGQLQGRSIDRVPGGSLIVNIRQGNNYGPRGRHVGLIRGRQR